MKEEKRAANFDWVSERHACSLESMFGLLKHLAERDTAKHAELTQGARPARVTQPQGYDTFFAVVRGGNALMDRSGATFTLNPDHIRIEVQGGNTYIVKLTLNDDGYCKLKIGDTGEPLDPWQVMRLTLEPILF